MKASDKKLVRLSQSCNESFYINSQNCLVHSQTQKKVSVATGDSSLVTDNQGCIQMLHDIEGKLNTGNKTCLALDNTLKEIQCSSSNGDMEFVIERGQ